MDVKRGFGSPFRLFLVGPGESVEKQRQEECPTAAAEEPRRRKNGLISPAAAAEERMLMEDQQQNPPPLRIAGRIRNMASTTSRVL